MFQHIIIHASIQSELRKHQSVSYSLKVTIHQRQI